MIYIVIGMSILFVAIGFFVTEKNAKSLLSGYNEMSEEEQQKFDLKSYLAFFKKFHFFLGISFLIGFCVFFYFVNSTAGLLFWGIYPVLAYIYFAFKSSNFSKKSGNQWHKFFSFTLLISILVLLIWIFADGFTENKLIYKTTAIEITGSYGEIVPKSEIKSVELVNELPKISKKTDGFEVGGTRKGYFKTENGKIVKLLLNTERKPILLITLKNGKKIYYSAKSKSNKELIKEIEKIRKNNQVMSKKRVTKTHHS